MQANSEEAFSKEKTLQDIPVARRTKAVSCFLSLLILSHHVPLQLQFSLWQNSWPELAVTKSRVVIARQIYSERRQLLCWRASSHSTWMSLWMLSTFACLQQNRYKGTRHSQAPEESGQERCFDLSHPSRSQRHVPHFVMPSIPQNIPFSAWPHALLLHALSCLARQGTN